MKMRYPDMNKFRLINVLSFPNPLFGKLVTVHKRSPVSVRSATAHFCITYSGRSVSLTVSCIPSRNYFFYFSGMVSTLSLVLLSCFE